MYKNYFYHPSIRLLCDPYLGSGSSRKLPVLTSQTRPSRVLNIDVLKLDLVFAIG